MNAAVLAPQVLGHGPSCGTVVRAEYRGTAVAVRFHNSELSVAAHDRRHSVQRSTSILFMPIVAISGTLGGMSWKKDVDCRRSESSLSRAGPAVLEDSGSRRFKKSELDSRKTCSGSESRNAQMDVCQEPERPELAGGYGKVSQIEMALDKVLV